MSTPQPQQDLAGFTAPAPLVHNRHGRSRVVLVCEHASCFMPPELNGLGLARDALSSHIAWDPGALPVAESMADELDAALVAAQVSRLVYDCNRPPHAPGAMPARSEVYDVPGNAWLNQAARQLRTELVYEPFRQTLSQVLGERLARPAVLVTIHSFTRVYDGLSRDVELGILCDRDARLADAMLALAPGLTGMDVRKNEPYGPQDGVTHTLIEHGLANSIHNVMIEVRNDLIATRTQQTQVAAMLCALVGQAMDNLEAGAPGAASGQGAA